MASVTVLPGAKDVPPPPAVLVQADQAKDCIYAKVRRDVEACPVCAVEPGRTAWSRLWTAGLEWLSLTTDWDVMVRLAELHDELAHHRWVLRVDGHYVKGQRGGLVAHPAVSQLRTGTAELTKLEALCGFNPSDRGRLGVGEVGGGKAEHPLALLLAKRLAT